MVRLRAWISGLSAFLVFGTATSAFDDCRPSWSSISYAVATYIIPSPISYVPVPGPIRIPCPCTPVIRYASPTPAPASPGPGVLASHEPPLATKPAAKHGPTISQNRAFSNIPQNNTEPRREMCSVTFWNLTGTDVKLAVNDGIHPLAKDRAKTFDLFRNRVIWQIDSQLPKTEAIAEDLNYFDVLIK